MEQNFNIALKGSGTAKQLIEELKSVIKDLKYYDSLKIGGVHHYFDHDNSVGFIDTGDISKEQINKYLLK